MKFIFTISVSLFCLTAFGQVGTSVTNGLIGWWMPFGTNSSGTTVYDFSGIGNNGITANNPPNSSSITGTSNAISFNGSNQMVTNSFSIGSRVSVSFWAKCQITNASANQRLFSFGYTNGVNNTPNTFVVQITTGGGIRIVTITTNNVTGQVIGTTVNVATNQWIHVVAAYDGAHQLLYTNSVLAVSDNQTGDFNTNRDGCGFGNSLNATANTQWFSGLMADVKLYQRALTSYEIVLLYHEGQPWTTRQLGNPVGLYQRVTKP